MIVISDTSPINYLVLLEMDFVLPILFGEVRIPPGVLQEMRHEKTPLKVIQWVEAPPQWLTIQSPIRLLESQLLGPGELQAIALAQECEADLLLMDERAGSIVARDLGISIAGTLAVLELAARRELISLSLAFEDLRKTTFRGSEELMQTILVRHDARQGKPPVTPTND